MHTRSVVEADFPSARGNSPNAGVDFATAVRPHIRDALRQAQRILGSPDLAWDAVQESLLTLWTAPSWPEQLGPWLHRTVLHRSLHALRSRRRRETHEQRCAACVIHRWESPLCTLEKDDLAARLNAAIGSLPDEYRTVIERRELEGEEYVTIAAALDLPLGTVRSRLHRARALLRRRLVDEAHPR